MTRLSRRRMIWFRLSTHRLDRVLSFFSSRPNWDSPTPSPTGECAFASSYIFENKNKLIVVSCGFILYDRELLLPLSFILGSCRVESLLDETFCISRGKLKIRKTLNFSSENPIRS
jgi:hypothetical protein